MTAPSKRELTRAFQQVRAILWHDWDPIGCGVPEDEYDDYVWPVVARLMRGEDREALRDYLLRTAVEAIGCPPLTPQAQAGLERALDRLMALDVRIGGPS